jgi:LytS/YehU family sensor histidine kinase
LLGFCYFLYRDAYFSSWGNFGLITLPWLVFSLTVSMACKWWRRVMHRRFVKLEDWWKRLMFSILGYILLQVTFIFSIFFILKNLPFQGLAPVQERFYLAVISNFLILIIITIFYEGITYFSKWKEAISETEQLEKLTLESQFRSLQSQLNPHFLFNSFNVLSSLIAENPRRAEDFVDELSNVYRYLLRSNEQELASVGEELRFIRSFFHLLATRYDAGILLKINVKQENFNKKLPALALQVLVENAVKHNEISPEKPLTIEILDQFHSPENPDSVLVRNNMQRKATRVLSNRVGLDNLRQRYDLLGVPGFEVEDDGQFFSVSLPVL